MWLDAEAKKQPQWRTTLTLPGTIVLSNTHGYAGEFDALGECPASLQFCAVVKEEFGYINRSRSYR